MGRQSAAQRAPTLPGPPVRGKPGLLHSLQTCMQTCERVWGASRPHPCHVIYVDVCIGVQLHVYKQGKQAVEGNLHTSAVVLPVRMALRALMVCKNCEHSCCVTAGSACPTFASSSTTSPASSTARTTFCKICTHRYPCKKCVTLATLNKRSLARCRQPHHALLFAPARRPVALQTLQESCLTFRNAVCCIKIARNFH